MRRAKAAGVHVGRPPAPISEVDLDRVRCGELSASELARELGLSPPTVRRRLRERPRR